MAQRKSKYDTDCLLKISEVAQAAGESISTVKYYVKEGLVDIACKTGKNMAYYAPDSVERVKLIRTLQSERFYPLAVIRHMLRNKAADTLELKLLDTINKGDQSDYYERMPLADACGEAGLKPREADALVRAGLIVPLNSGRSRTCTRGDCRLMKLVKKRMAAGIPLQQTIKSFALYESHLLETTKKDIEWLVRDSILKKSFGTEDIMNIINVSDETLDSFITMRRYAMNAAVGADYIAKTETLLKQLVDYGRGVSALLKTLSCGETAARLDNVLAGQDDPDPTLAVYGELLGIGGTGLANTLSVLVRAGIHFSVPAPKTDSSQLDMVHGALRLGWMSFAPEDFGTERGQAEAALIKSTGDGIFTESILRLVDKLRE